jgi:hypothetical protein
MAFLAVFLYSKYIKKRTIYQEVFTPMASLSLTNVCKVYPNGFETAQYQINMSTHTLPSGNYIVKVITQDGKSKVGKFIVQ